MDDSPVRRLVEKCKSNGAFLFPSRFRTLVALHLINDISAGVAFWGVFTRLGSGG